MEKPFTLGSLQVRHLKTQLRYMSTLHKYHAWMAIELKDPELREAHLKVVTSIQEVFDHLDFTLEVQQTAERDATEEK